MIIIKETSKLFLRFWNFIRVSFNQTIGSFMHIGLAIFSSFPGIEIDTAKRMFRKLIKGILGIFMVFFLSLVGSTFLTNYLDYAVTATSAMYPTIDDNKLILYRSVGENTNIKYDDIIILNTKPRANFIKGDGFSIKDFGFPFKMFAEYFYADATDSINRIIALPGDTIKIENGLIYVNGNQLKERDIIYNFNDTVSYQQTTLGENQYFVLPDNRNYANFETINYSEIKGIILFK